MSWFKNLFNKNKKKKPVASSIARDEKGRWIYDAPEKKEENNCHCDISVKKCACSPKTPTDKKPTATSTQKKKPASTSTEKKKPAPKKK